MSETTGPHVVSIPLPENQKELDDNYFKSCGQPMVL